MKEIRETKQYKNSNETRTVRLMRFLLLLQPVQVVGKVIGFLAVGLFVQVFIEKY